MNLTASALSGPRCNLCGQLFAEPIYRSPQSTSLTTGGLLVPEPTEVYFCSACAHVHTRPILDLDRYYDQDYNINLHSAEEDDLYAWTAARTIYRSEHQAETLLNQLPLVPGAAVLDYGCGKATSSRRLLQARPDLRVHLFDVSDNYRPFWSGIGAEADWATYRMPAAWQGRFDAIYSFFVLEHVTAVPDILAELAQALKPAGLLYVLVPNLFRNTGDLLVVDHVNHFTRRSAAVALHRAGLALVAVDEESHSNALILTARRGAIRLDAGPPAEVDVLHCQVQALSEGWLRMQREILAFEANAQGRVAGVIYGSGFYGCLIAATLKDRSRIGALLDQNPHRQGQRRLGLPVVAPDGIPPGTDHAYIGLNPATAPAELDQVRARLGRVSEVFTFPK